MVSRESLINTPSPMVHKVHRKSPRETSYDSSLNAQSNMRVDMTYQTYLDGYIGARGSCRNAVDLRQEAVSALSGLVDPSQLLWDMFYQQGGRTVGARMLVDNRLRRAAAAIILESLVMHFSAVAAVGQPSHIRFMHPVMGICQLIDNVITENYIMSYGVRPDSFLCGYFIENPSFLALMIHRYCSVDVSYDDDPHYHSYLRSPMPISAFSNVKDCPPDRKLAEKTLYSLRSACDDLVKNLSRDWYLGKYGEEDIYDQFYPVPERDAVGGGGAAAFNFYNHKWEGEYGHNRGELLWYIIRKCSVMVGSTYPLSASNLWLVSHTIGQVANRRPMNSNCKQGIFHGKIKFEKAVD